jgi:predicted ferric reductase
MTYKKTPISENDHSAGYSLSGILLSALAAFAIFTLLVGGLALLFTPAGNWFASGLSWLFATDSTQLWWYVTRSAGILAYLLLWLSTVWGLAVPSKIISPVLDQSYTFDFHEFISLLAIGFALLHILVLSLDRYLPYSTLQILIPFLSPYRPLWVGIGVISFYIIVLVTVTFYLRSRIGMKNFRAIHILSLLGYLGITLHGLYAGTDSPLLSMQLLYRGTGLVVIFLTIYWLVQKYLQNVEKKQKAEQARLPSRRPSSMQQRKIH